MFSCMCVCQLSSGGGPPCDYYHHALDLTVQTPNPAPAPGHQTCILPGPSPAPLRHETLDPQPLTSDMEPPASDIWWPSLKTCSNFFT